MINIRLAEIADLQEIVTVDNIAFPWATSQWNVSPFIQMIMFFPDTFFVAEEDGKIVGYVIAGTKGNNPKEAYGSKIAVLPEYQGTGVSSKLMSNLRYILREKGIERIFLLVRPENDKARRIYMNWGFEEKKFIKDFYSQGEDTLIMECDLTK